MHALIEGITNLGVGNAIMFAVGGVLIYLAIARQYDPTLLLPMGFGCLLANIPLSGAIDQTMADGSVEHGPLSILFDFGIAYGELFPLLIFIAIGAMIDFTPLLRNPFMLLFGAAAQLGVFLTIVLAAAFGFSLRESAAIGIIGAADGPTSIYVATRFAPEWLGAITVAAYSYMALVPVIQPMVIKLLTTREERAIVGHTHEEQVAPIVRVIFPIAVTLVASILVPKATPLIGFLMFGNLVRECGVLDRLSKGAQNELANIVTLLLGLTIGATMRHDQFLQPATLGILAMGFLAFVFDTAGGVLFAKGLNLVMKRKINPMLGACGISAFPMSARVIHQMAQRENPQNVLLMQAVGANVGGQIGSVVAGGLVLALVV